MAAGERFTRITTNVGESCVEFWLDAANDPYSRSAYSILNGLIPIDFPGPYHLYIFDTDRRVDWKDGDVPLSTPLDGWVGGYRILGVLASVASTCGGPNSWSIYQAACLPASQVDALSGKLSFDRCMVPNVEYVAHPKPMGFYCFANDWKGYYDNNSGCIKARICKSNN